MCEHILEFKLNGTPSKDWIYTNTDVVCEITLCKFCNLLSMMKYEYLYKSVFISLPESKCYYDFQNVLSILLL